MQIAVYSSAADSVEQKVSLVVAIDKEIVYSMSFQEQALVES